MCSRSHYAVISRPSLHPPPPLVLSQVFLFCHLCLDPFGADFSPLTHLASSVFTILAALLSPNDIATSRGKTFSRRDEVKFGPFIAAEVFFRNSGDFSGIVLQFLRCLGLGSGQLPLPAVDLLVGRLGKVARGLWIGADGAVTVHADQLALVVAVVHSE
ncbi:hypothetical protein FRB95_007579 [Tulasnella sp. JGI-2019a]|nr:hypothetical protein FRB95_007579 [Tulasnella sp. JGI-2019a]